MLLCGTILPGLNDPKIQNLLLACVGLRAMDLSGTGERGKAVTLVEPKG